VPGPGDIPGYWYVHPMPSTWPPIVLVTVVEAATVLGALFLYLAPRPSRRVLDLLLGAAAGLMLSATVVSLLVPAMADPGRLGPFGLGAAVLVGAFAVRFVDRLIPHDLITRGPSGADVDVDALRRSTLLVSAMAIHNVPEGVALGIGVGADAAGSGLALAIGLAAQNLPEGFAVAVALFALGCRRRTAVALSTLTAVIEFAGGATGLGLAEIGSLLPGLLGVAAGAMLYVVIHEIVPQAHRNGNESLATTGLLAGFAVMFAVGVALA